MAAYFTGREGFALTLAGAVLRSRVTVMYGQSGCGKSSVLGAAFPQVMAATLRDPDEPAPGLSHRLLYFDRWHRGFETLLLPKAAAELNAPAGAGLAAAIGDWTRANRVPDTHTQVPVILVFDQFEEFLLYHPKPTETAFVRDLAMVVADPDIEARVLLSMREDSLAGLDALRAVIPGILWSPVQLRPLDRRAAEQAIRRPVAKWSEEHFGDAEAVAVEDSLVETLLDQVRQTGVIRLSAEPLANSNVNLVELPLLQLALERLWEEETKAERHVLRARTLQQLGGATGIARRHLDWTLEALPAAQRELAIRLFRHLVTAAGGKHAWRADDLAEEIGADSRAEQQAIDRMAGPTRISDASRRLLGIAGPGHGPEATKAAVNDILNKLAQGRARILRTQPDPSGQGPLFELFHDALTRPVLSWAQEARVEEAVHRLSMGDRVPRQHRAGVGPAGADPCRHRARRPSRRGLEGRIQPGRHAGGDRVPRQHGAGVGPFGADPRRHYAQRSSQRGLECDVQPRRQTGCDRVPRQHCAGVGLVGADPRHHCA
jgi:hypothetical protein